MILSLHSGVFLECICDVLCLVSSTVPDVCENTTESLIHFSQEFSARYGNTHPSFYMGPLDEAMKDAFNVSAKEVSLFNPLKTSPKYIWATVYGKSVL